MHCQKSSVFLEIKLTNILVGQRHCHGVEDVDLLVRVLCTLLSNLSSLLLLLLSSLGLSLLALLCLLSSLLACSS